MSDRRPVFRFLPSLAPPKSSPHDELSVLAEAVVGGTVRRDEGLLHGPRGSLRVWGGRLGAVLFVQGNLPATRSLDAIDLELWGVSTVLAARFRLAGWDGVELCGFAGPGLDIVTYGPTTARDPAVQLAPEETEVRPKAAVGLGLVMGRFEPRLALVAEMGVSLLRTRYQVRVGDHAEYVGSAGIVSPTLGLEVTIGRAAR